MVIQVNFGEDSNLNSSEIAAWNKTITLVNAALGEKSQNIVLEQAADHGTARVLRADTPELRQKEEQLRSWLRKQNRTRFEKFRARYAVKSLSTAAAGISTPKRRLSYNISQMIKEISAPFFGFSTDSFYIQQEMVSSTPLDSAPKLGKQGGKVQDRNFRLKHVPVDPVLSDTSVSTASRPRVIFSSTTRKDRKISVQSMWNLEDWFDFMGKTNAIDFSIHDVSFIKVDIEGYEKFFIPAAAESLSVIRPKVVVSLHPQTDFATTSELKQVVMSLFAAYGKENCYERNLKSEVIMDKIRRNIINRMILSPDARVDVVDALMPWYVSTGKAFLPAGFNESLDGYVGAFDIQTVEVLAGNILTNTQNLHNFFQSVFLKYTFPKVAWIQEEILRISVPWKLVLDMATTGEIQKIEHFHLYLKRYLGIANPELHRGKISLKGLSKVSKAAFSTMRKNDGEVPFEYDFHVMNEFKMGEHGGVDIFCRAKNS